MLGEIASRVRWAVAPEGDPRSGQKTEPDHGITELHGDEARNIPAPPREQLAAHPEVKPKREKPDEETDECGIDENVESRHVNASRCVSTHPEVSRSIKSYRVTLSVSTERR